MLHKFNLAKLVPGYNAIIYVYYLQYRKNHQPKWILLLRWLRHRE